MSAQNWIIFWVAFLGGTAMVVFWLTWYEIRIPIVTESCIVRAFRRLARFWRSAWRGY